MAVGVSRWSERYILGRTRRVLEELGIQEMLTKFEGGNFFEDGGVPDVAAIDIRTTTTQSSIGSL